jgi:hypothetical protein
MALKIQRAEYEGQLAQRRFEEVDPVNRLVAATLEQRWEHALQELQNLRQQYRQYQGKPRLSSEQQTQRDFWSAIAAACARQHRQGPKAHLRFALGYYTESAQPRISDPAFALARRRHRRPRGGAAT